MSVSGREFCLMLSSEDQIWDDAVFLILTGERSDKESGRMGKFLSCSCFPICREEKRTSATLVVDAFVLFAVLLRVLLAA